MMILFLDFALATCPKIKTIQHGSIQSKQIRETSGLVVHNGKIWLHNDSGDRARLFSVDIKTQTEEEHELSLESATDWEDIALDREREILFIADTGDNRERRKNITVHAYSLKEGTIESYSYQLDTGPRDIESIAYDPRDQQLYLLSKGRRGTVFLYPTPQV